MHSIFSALLKFAHCFTAGARGEFFVEIVADRIANECHVAVAKNELHASAMVAGKNFHIFPAEVLRSVARRHSEVPSSSEASRLFARLLTRC